MTSGKGTPERYYVGLAASFHDPAVAILNPKGIPLFAESTERFLQNKRAYHCAPDDFIRVPRLVREFCPPGAELVVGVSWSAGMLLNLNMAAFSTAVETPSPAAGPQSIEDFAWPLPDVAWMVTGFRNSLSLAGLNLKGSRRIPNPVTIRRYDHHLAHAAVASYTSPFDECSVAVVDGYGENRSTSFLRYAEGKLTFLPGQLPDSPAELRQHTSLGHFYSRLCALCGFDPILGEEWKVMGLAGYGSFDPEIHELMRPLIAVRGLGLRAGCSDEEMSGRLAKLKKFARRDGSPAEEVAGLAFTGQRVFEEIMTDLLVQLHEKAPSDNLAFCGGCALNSSYSGRILEQTGFERLHVPSAPADDGCALGAALLAFQEDHLGADLPSEVASPYLGSGVPAGTLQNLETFGGFPHIRLALPALIDRVSSLLSEGRIVGWMRGRAEFGPRALGHRSILADPRRDEMKDRLNSRVKFREEFRPFAPSILDEYGPEYFENYQPSRYMERTLRFRPEKAQVVPAVVHVDGTGRVQSVKREWDAVFYDLIRAFFEKTGVPIILNTSLNVMGRPIAHSVEDALGIFWTTGVDALVMEDILLSKIAAPSQA